MFESFLGILQCLVRLEVVKMREHSHDLRKAVKLEEIEKLKGIHLESVARIDHEQHHVGHLRKVSHGVNVITGALEEGDPFVLPRNQRDGTLGVDQILPGINLDQRTDEKGLAHALHE